MKSLRPRRSEKMVVEWAVTKVKRGTDCLFCNLSVALPTSQLFLQPFCCFTYVTAHSPTLLSLLRHRLFTYVTWRTAHAVVLSPRKAVGPIHILYELCSLSKFPSLHLRHISFSNPSVALPTSQLILQPFRCFTHVPGHSPTLLSLLLRHRLFTYVTWWAAHTVVLNPRKAVDPIHIIWALLILQVFRHFTNVTAHSPTLPLLHLRHSSFSNASFASPTSQALHLRQLASRPWNTTETCYTSHSEVIFLLRVEEII